jgi:type IV secretion system protein VirB11
MSTAASTIYLETCLEPLAPFLARQDLTDIYVNRPGEVWTESVGAATERHLVPDLTAGLLMRMVRQIAALTAQGISREHPILSAVLPGGERVQAIIPPATRGDVALAIRKQVEVSMRLDDYRARKVFDATRIETMDEHVDRDREPQVWRGQDDAIGLLRKAVRERRNILISGGTSTGKTTFLNALLAEVPPDERLIAIEDTPELQLDRPNSVGLIAARGALSEAMVTTDDLLIASLRMRPDRIILGEIRGSEAVTFLRAVNTGHPGSLTTIHAESPARSIDQLALLVLQTGMRLSWDDVVTYVRRSLDLIVQLERGPDGRVVRHIVTA